MSGGMRQRAMIALALACNPRVLIADEPTTALDVTIQAQVLDLLRRLQAELGMSILFVTHNLGVVAEIAQHVVVMYAGRVVEAAPVDALFERQRHPYTKGLLACLPTAQHHDFELGGERPRADADPRQRAERAGAAGGLLLRAALPVPHREMHREPAAAAAADAGACQPLLEA